jgi:murein DD-endopeptidase MepM/ murein hydrolase activator NlpD
MLIPHSEKKVFNFRINFFALFMFIFVSLSAVVTVVLLIQISSSEILKMKSAQSTKEMYERRSNEYQDMISKILEKHSLFKSNLITLTSNLNSDVLRGMQEYDGQGGALNPVDYAEKNDFEIEKAGINNLLNDYQYSIQALSEVNKMAKSYNKLLQELPFGSPVKGPCIITSGFGLRIHPIHKILDMHTGIDLAYQLGTPIVATAPGKVEKIDWDPFGYGWYVKISHKLGFTTLYAHMRSCPVVAPGDEVAKGTIIGYMGRTGSATGTHVHYEIRLGDNLLDPWKFVSIY